MGITILSTDYQTVTQKVAKRQLEGNKLSVEQVPVCNCVQVTDLNSENTTRDAVLYYFDNPKNAGGVTNVELNCFKTKDGHWSTLRTHKVFDIFCFEMRNVQIMLNYRDLDLPKRCPRLQRLG